MVKELIDRGRDLMLTKILLLGGDQDWWWV